MTILEIVMIECYVLFKADHLSVLQCIFVVGIGAIPELILCKIYT
jgi:hypothetical protein